MEIELKPRSCIGCGGTDATPLFRELVTCSSCGLVYYPRRLTRAELDELYSTAYFQGQEYYDYLADRCTHEANFRRRIKRLLPWIPSGSRVFEIGCSYGFFLNLARSDWQVRGCDIAAEPVRHAEKKLGLSVHMGDFLDLPLRRGDVDAFCLWDTIEHLDSPEDYLQGIADVLPTGGILALTTGDIGSWLARWRGPGWRQIHPPTHICYFSLATMRHTLSRFGFDLVWSAHVGMSRSLAQIVYSLTSLGRPEPSWLHRFFVKSGLGNVRLWLNSWDLMMVVARRRTAQSPALSQEAA